MECAGERASDEMPCTCSRTPRHAAARQSGATSHKPAQGTSQFTDITEKHGMNDGHGVDDVETGATWFGTRLSKQ
jgi:hypothetical protein